MLTTPPAKHKNTVLNQICDLIPSHLTSKLARKHGIRTRKLSPWSHVVSLLYAQLPHAIGLNDVCDSLRLFGGWLSRIRGATPPKRNTLSNANRKRSASRTLIPELSFSTMTTNLSHGERRARL